MTDTFTTPEAQLDRDRYGRPMVFPTPDAKRPVPYTRCTTFVSALEDTYNLNRWQQRMVALGLAERPDLVMSVAANRDDKPALNRICDEAAEAAKAKTAANIGTALHALTERLDRGEEVGTVPPDYVADVAAYEQATAHLSHLHVERFCVLDRWRIGGTPDRIVEHDGRRYIADLKTGGIEYGVGKIAMQLAVYARSSLYDITTRERTQHDADLDRALIIHLPAGSGQCTLHWVDISDTATGGWYGVKLARQVRDWRARKFGDFVKSPEPFLTDEEAIAVLINSSDTVDALYVLYNQFESEWTDNLTKLAASRKSDLQGRVA